MSDRSFEIATAQGRVWRCSDCGDDREFVQPPCADGHPDDGGECPEGVCAGSGTAVVTAGGATEVAVPTRLAA